MLKLVHGVCIIQFSIQVDFGHDTAAEPPQKNDKTIGPGPLIHNPYLQSAEAFATTFVALGSQVEACRALVGDAEMDEGVVTIVPGDCFLLSDEIAEHAPNASFDYDAKVWKFTASEFTALHAVIKEFGLKVEFVPPDDEDDDAGSNDESGD